MDRRNFIQNILTAGASFMILPGIGRIWKQTSGFLPCYIESFYTYKTKYE